jgi:NADH:ubiquinone oxidoreductase subunit H
VSGIYNDPIGHWVVVVLAIALLLFVVLTATAYTVLFERVALGHIQRRPGPNRVGPYGLLQLACMSLPRRSPWQLRSCPGR